MAHVSADFYNVASITDAIIDHYDGLKQDSFHNTLLNLKEEINCLDKTLERKIQSYTSYKL